MRQQGVLLTSTLGLRLVAATCACEAAVPRRKGSSSLVLKAPPGGMHAPWVSLARAAHVTFLTFEEAGMRTPTKGLECGAGTNRERHTCDHGMLSAVGMTPLSLSPWSRLLCPTLEFADR